VRLDVVTPTGPLLSEEVEEVTAPGILGEFGVLPGHIPFLTGIRPGVLRYRRGAQDGGVVAVGPGFAEVGHERVVVLCEVGLPAAKIDRAAAEKELVDAQVQLDRWDSDDEGARVDLEARRDWARARLEAASAASPASAH
jgi:F-type H+-transporting ATPase subunit epsilon